MNDERISKKLLSKLREKYPERFDPELSYGFIPPAPQPTDILYRLDYNPNTRYLKLNTHVIKQFQYGKRNDEIFGKLFKQKSWIKTIKLKSPDKASEIIKNCGIPKTLSNAIFDAGDNETTLIVYTVIRRDRANEFNVNFEEVKNFIVKIRDQHNNLLKLGKRK